MTENKEKLIVSIVEAHVVGQKFNFEGKDYDFASDFLKNNGFELFYETNTNVLTQSQRELYNKIILNISKDLLIFIDPIIVSFAIKDACDYSNIDYIWLDLEGNNHIGNSVWTNKKDVKNILFLTNHFLEKHLEKYMIDVYDRETRDDLTKIWESQINLSQCQVCGSVNLDRRLIVKNETKFRGWVCTNCSHHIILPSDIMNFLNKDEKL